MPKSTEVNNKALAQSSTIFYSYRGGKDKRHVVDIVGINTPKKNTTLFSVYNFANLTREERKDRVYPTTESIDRPIVVHFKDLLHCFGHNSLDVMLDDRNPLHSHVHYAIEHTLDTEILKQILFVIKHTGRIPKEKQHYFDDYFTDEAQNNAISDFAQLQPIKLPISWYANPECPGWLEVPGLNIHEPNCIQAAEWLSVNVPAYPPLSIGDTAQYLQNQMPVQCIHANAMSTSGMAALALLLVLMGTLLYKYFFDNKETPPEPVNNKQAGLKN